MLEDTSLIALFLILFFLLVLSAFFSSSETALMSLNRYRLKHLAQQGHRGAMIASSLLARPDRLIGLILLGNNFVNIFASAIATVIGIKLLGENGIVVATFTLTLVILLFAEVTPKTLAALHPERVAYPASFVLKPLLFILYPLVWFTSIITNRLLRLFGVSREDATSTAINIEELRVALMEAGSMIPNRHKDMLMSILDLEQVTVNDVMVPRNEIEGIDINQPFAEIVKQLSHCGYTRLPVYRDSMDNIVGILHVRKALNLMTQDNLNLQTFESIVKEAYFVPEDTPLNTQLIQFQRKLRRTGLVVDEYGDLLGLITLEDIFREIVGEFTANTIDDEKEIHPQSDGSYLINGSANIRELNRTLDWGLPTDGPKTINGLVLEYLESIPDPGVSLRINDYIIEVIQTADNAIRTVRLRQLQPSSEAEQS
ncbi:MULTISPECIES: HlyC/CorC family transporter [unclassified Methylophaga]|jgi:Mg2+/Co2+ transporter CorB|uniref:HlyC/CorC family transporter n=2 Tax=Methylophaga TaxID=40222 RepID=UPI000C9595B0|nr:MULTISPECIES: HlyC/CorC family transporter [unclassified Methylophaga]MAK66983.1 magnesium/cobalt efflux protein [Methylophaga sp.]MAY18020.1 magnesium/cobalt efflux protein [Methylophaga sp.]MBN45449.1 magnesium/cobalt efflux protein [Methylophaga sp.]HAO26363.1 magnesium/cobalt efflux protein [Methylophaga sp.]HCD05984.1 magnesium/cobalt efflux protein [Methylophaga sp.]|tara:strand:+ start:3735 stop:5018 length:1284 start_codon:yes stop_codon:yes gene_type:complete